MPVADKGQPGKAAKFNLEECRAWQKARNASSTSRSNGFTDVARERARKERAQALLAEQSFAVKAGDLLPREAVERRWSAELTALRAKLSSFPRSQMAEQLFRTAVLDGQGAFDDLLAAAFDELMSDLSQPASVKKKKRGRAA